MEVGRVGRAHGVRGDVMVSLTTNRTERVQAGAVLYAGDRRLVVEAGRPHQGRFIVHFAGVHTREGADELRGAVLSADPIAEAGDGELWAHELIGSRVVDRAGVDLGCVVAVEANPAHDLLVLDRGGLVPMVFVVEHRAGVVTVDPPSGLLD
ncbi:MAG TPA: ribosome maturation factor RimM [Acidimicrobiia bacterium]|nr:ribosome maturation factor RimM [Acidimicrobiia bacterium]